MDQLIESHDRACDGFSRVAELGRGRWDRPSPCDEWDAGAVVEHVIGFHDVLLLRPLGAKPERPREDPAARWRVTVPAIRAAIRRDRPDRVVEVPHSAPIDLGRLLPMLTTDVLVHTWDLARAIGEKVELAPDLCQVSFDTVAPNEERLRTSGMFAAAVPVLADADIVTRLIAFLGRDPNWGAPA